MPFFDLRRLILLLSLTVLLFTFFNAIHATYQAQRNQLLEHTLETNRVYAAKLAQSTDQFLRSAQLKLSYSARLLPAILHDKAQLDAEVRRLREQTHMFNATLVVDPAGHVLAAAPASLNLVGMTLDTEGARASLTERKPLISTPYISVTGWLVIFISHPVTAADGTYLGYVGGAIYLREENALKTLLGEHFYQDGSYLYVVDRDRRVLYHRDQARLGEVVSDNPVIEAVIRGEKGSQRVINSRGVDMLAGYAPIPISGWGIVSQRPTDATLKQLDSLMLGTLLDTLPLSLLSLLAIWWLSRLIARPLQELAMTAPYWESTESRQRIEQVHSWYFEAEQLKRAMLSGLSLLHQRLGQLNQESITDPLTGLTNRRGMQLTIGQWQTQGIAFSVAALDIDFFKTVNDTCGHDVGDEVLRFLAEAMHRVSRSSDLLCRTGGEEFMLLLPHTTTEVAQQVLERLRACLAETPAPCGWCITLSAGVAHWPRSDISLVRVFELADHALYQAKHEGRNRVVVAPDRSLLME